MAREFNDVLGILELQFFLYNENKSFILSEFKKQIIKVAPNIPYKICTERRVEYDEYEVITVKFTKKLSFHKAVNLINNMIIKNGITDSEFCHQPEKNLLMINV